MKVITVFLIAFFILCPTLQAEPLSPCREKAELFFNTLLKGDVEAAYNTLSKDASVFQKNPEALPGIKKQTAKALSYYGKALSFEYIDEKTFGSSIIRLVYVLKCQEHPIIWELFFYKTKQGWIPGKVRFNDQFQFLVN